MNNKYKIEFFKEIFENQQIYTLQDIVDYVYIKHFDIDNLISFLQTEGLFTVKQVPFKEQVDKGLFILITITQEKKQINRVLVTSKGFKYVTKLIFSQYKSY